MIEYKRNDLNCMIFQLEKALRKYYNSDNVFVSSWESYGHEGGVKVEGFEKKQWVYFPVYRLNNKGKAIKINDLALWKAERKIKFFSD